ncbi:hypothetical protein [Roseibium sp.]|uniref:hypothetical protein n=1 Tax=Roseibium sp. TaxID=1936156 RepID=UPI003D0D0B7E
MTATEKAAIAVEMPIRADSQPKMKSKAVMATLSAVSRLISGLFPSEVRSGMIQPFA